jgi:hypothetical protein
MITKLPPKAPSFPRTFAVSPLVSASRFVCLIAGLLAVIAHAEAVAQDQAAPTQATPAIPAASSPAKSAKPDPAQAKQAQTLLKQAHAALLSRRTIRADVLELATLSEPPLRMTGTYVSAGLKLRLDYQVRLPGNVEGSLLTVCDGERLWSLMKLPESQQVTRRDVRQILAAAERYQGNPERAASVDLALGGLPALLTSLQRSMSFDAVKEDTLDEQPVWILNGRWNSQLATELGGDATKPNYPEHIPDGVRVSLVKDSLFPARLLYVKRREVGLRPLLDLRFRNVVVDGPVTDEEFRFTPPEATEPQDVTRQYIEQLFPESAQIDEAPARP